jgi:hypothetical protein
MGRGRASPPEGFSDHLSRRQVAALLGFGSEFKVRQLEKAGRLRAVRGAMGSAWYPRDQVTALKIQNSLAARAAAPRGSGLDGTPLPRGHARWSDGDLVNLLRSPLPAGEGSEPAQPRPRTVVDLVAETGIPIARAEQVHRFWLAHDMHPSAVRARAGGELAPTSPTTRPPRRPPSDLPPASTPSPPAAPALNAPSERRSAERLSRAALIRQMRDPDPRVRAAAFENLRKLEGER